MGLYIIEEAEKKYNENAQKGHSPAKILGGCCGHTSSNCSSCWNDWKNQCLCDKCFVKKKENKKCYYFVSATFHYNDSNGLKIKKG